MFKAIFRIALFIGGIVVAIDAIAPVAIEDAQVDRHSTSRSSTSPSGSQGANSRFWETGYNIWLSGARVSSCALGYTGYTAVNDGDTISIQSSRIFRECVDIKRGGEHIYRERYWRIFRLVFAAILVGTAVGWISSDGDININVNDLP